MSDQSQTTAKAPTEPQLCKMGCGFFGSGATGDCCSKCFNQARKAKEAAAGTSNEIKTKRMDVVAEEPAPMELEETPSPVPEVASEEPAAAPKKRKKKKASYKKMMAGMLAQGSSPEKDIEKEKELLRKVTGGGAFTKIEKI